jgi:transposase InsO family protein
MLVVLVLAVLIAGVLQLGLYLRAQLSLERATATAAELLAGTPPRTPPATDREAALERALGELGIAEADYGLRVRQVRLDDDPPAAVTYWERSYGGRPAGTAIDPARLLSPAASDDEVVLLIEARRRIPGAGLLFDALRLGESRRVVHIDSQPTYSYARWSSGRSASGVSISGGGTNAADASGADEAVYSDLDMTDGRRYVETTLDGGTRIDFGWSDAPGNTTAAIADAGLGVRVDLTAGTLSFDDGSGYSVLVTGVAAGDRVGVALDLDTGQLWVRHRSGGGPCQTLTGPVAVAPGGPVAAAATLGPITASTNRIAAHFGASGFDCKPAGFEGVRQVN